MGFREAVDGYSDRAEEYEEEMDEETFKTIEGAYDALSEVEGEVPLRDRARIERAMVALRPVVLKWEWEYYEGDEEDEDD